MVVTMIKKWLKRFVYRLRGEYTVEKLIEMGLTVGKNFNPQLGVNLDPSHCWLIKIGDDVTMAPHVQILAHDAGMYAYVGHTKLGRVEIGNHVFIGAGSIVLPGVTIGSDVVIGAGSVVTHSIPDGFVYAGNPACKICSTKEYIAKHRQLMEHRPVWDEHYTLRKNIDVTKKQEQWDSLADGAGYVE